MSWPLASTGNTRQRTSVPLGAPSAMLNSTMPCASRYSRTSAVVASIGIGAEPYIVMVAAPSWPMMSSVLAGYSTVHPL
jgi:hypothetical protein